jgi:hypothetical protein
MQKLKTPFSIAVLIAITMLWTACKKEVSNQPMEIPTGMSEQKQSGVVPDDPLLLSKVPVIMSSDMMNNVIKNPDLLISLRGKPVRNVDATAPTVSITSPANGASVSGQIAIGVSATDNVGVTSVTLSVDNVSTSISSINSPFTLNWNTGSVPNGSHTLKVTAKDAASNSGVSSSISVNVNNTSAIDGISPSITITSPTSGASLAGNTTISINTSASDNVGVTSRTISIDGSVVSTGSSYSWNTGTATSGLHTISATAKDAAGNQGSTSITVTVNTTVINPPTTLPSSVQLVMPPVQLQGSESACVPFSVLYARDAEQYYKTGASSYSNSSNVFSPEFVYNQIKATTSCSSGASMINTLNFLVNKGVTTWSSMPYSDQNGCSTLPTSSQTLEAANYKIKSYSMVVAQDPTAIKTMLYNKHPLSFTFTVDANFYGAGVGYIWKSYSSTLYGPHAITLVGYDDTKKAYRAINQWGTGWGDGGYIWIDYTFFATIAYDLYAVNL